MKKIISFIFIIFLISCSDIVSDYQEQEEILDYEQYLYQAWNAFETVNLDGVLQYSSSAYYYNLALDMFNIKNRWQNSWLFASARRPVPVEKRYRSSDGLN